MTIGKLPLAGLLLLLVLSGCTAIQPYPMAARSGDTITLAVGSLDGMNPSNTTVTFTSAADSVPIDITGKIRSIFNLYADKASNTYSPSIQSMDDNFRYLHHEPWQTVIVLDLPTGLSEGPGVVNVHTTASKPGGPLEPGYVGTYPDLNTVDISLEILPGTGVSNRFKYKTLFDGTLTGNLNDLGPARQALVRPPVSDSAAQWPEGYGAIEVKLSVPMTDMIGTGVVDDASIRLVAQNVSSFTGSKAQVTWLYDGSDLTVLFISASGKLEYYEPRFSVLAETADFTQTPTVTSVRYFDRDGSEVAGPAISDYSIELLGSYF